jgi:putative transposase
MSEHPGNANLPIGAFKPANQEIGVPRWHSRGYLPHFERAELIQHVTFHLADSMAKEAVERMDTDIRCLPPEKRDAERRKRIQAWIDAGHGSCVLREPAVAGMVQNALLFFDGQRHRLLAWVVMPNHVHVLFQPVNGWTVAKIVASWKKFMARKISGNANLLIGAVWHREYWDRYIRDEYHLQQAVKYIDENPVKAGLAAVAEDWHWGSAYAQNANQEIGAPRAV